MDGGGGGGRGGGGVGLFSQCGQVFAVLYLCVDTDHCGPDN